jgi:hypothetical protein
VVNILRLNVKIPEVNPNRRHIIIECKSNRYVSVTITSHLKTELSHSPKRREYQIYLRQLEIFNNVTNIFGMFLKQQTLLNTAHICVSS